MAYEKLNLQDGQVLDAAALAHMEAGIENAVPPPDGKTYQQFVTDGEGNEGWAERLAYADQAVLFEDGQWIVSTEKFDQWYKSQSILSITGTIEGNQYTNCLIFGSLSEGYSLNFLTDDGTQDIGYITVGGEGNVEKIAISVGKKLSNIFLSKNIPVVPHDTYTSGFVRHAQGENWEVQPVYVIDVNMFFNEVTLPTESEHIYSIQKDQIWVLQIYNGNNNVYSQPLCIVEMDNALRFVAIYSNQEGQLEVITVDWLRDDNTATFTHTPLFNPTI